MNILMDPHNLTIDQRSLIRVYEDLIDDVPRLFVCAITNIEAKSELYWDYGSDFFDGHNLKCFSNSKNCKYVS